MVRKELSDVLKHEIFRSGSVLRSTFFTILSLLLAAKKYVGEHYMDSTLSLDGTAAQLGISPSYLSRISARSTESALPSTSATCASSRPSACSRTRASWCATSGRRSAS